MTHITVAIPVFNRARLVGRTIESVLAQDHRDFDLLVVDDASQDDTTTVVRQYGAVDSRLRLVVNEKNLGLTRNWNRCLELAHGPLVQLLLSDDLLDADYLGLVDRAFAGHPEIGFVATSCRYIDGADQIISPGRSRPPRLFLAGDEALRGLLTGGFPHVSSIVMRTACLEQAGVFDEAIWHGPDVEMDARLAHHFGYFYLEGVHTSFRRHGTNMGRLEFLRKDFLKVDAEKKRRAWEYLSAAGRQSLGAGDLDAFIARDTAQTALVGAIIVVGLGRPELSRFYLREAVRLDGLVWKRPAFWKALALNLLPGLGVRVMQRRMKIGASELAQARTVERALAAVGTR